MANMPLNQKEIDFIINQLQNKQPLPEDLRYKLFPVKHKEYELVYGGKMRKEDILANEDGVFPVPLQIEKVFTSKRKTWEDGWRNMIVFGDNLQFLKTVYDNKDPLIKNKIKGKVKLIYIDPPFSTNLTFNGSGKQKAYTDKVRGAEFVEFLRRRLVLAKELLAPDGSIFVHLDQKMCHQVRLILDEIFGENKFQNQIIWQGTSAHNDAKKKYGNIHQVIYWYYNQIPPTYNYDEVREGISKANLKEYSKLELKSGEVIPLKDNEHLVGNGNRIFRTVDATWKGTSKEKQFTWRGSRPNSKREWRYNYEGMESAFEKGELYLTNPKKGAIRCLKKYLDDNPGQILQDIWINSGRMSGGKGTYPTEKPEVLLSKIIKSVTTQGDLVLDFFGGSGTTAVVAEKLNRKWITCDIGKLAFYTIQKRMLDIEHSNSPEHSKKYGGLAKTFVTVNTGQYDLQKVFELKQEDFKEFVMELFEVEPLKNKKISGIPIDGQKKDGFYTIIYPFWKFKDAAVDQEYLEDLHSHIGKKIGSRLYIIALSNDVDFISDYIEIEDIRYYFLKVPYQIIKELHRVEFKKFRQPQSKSNVNALEDAVGFHFMRQPKVKSKLKTKQEEVEIHIKEFYSDFTEEETGNDMDNFESLSMVLIDNDYDGEAFNMDAYYFAEDLLPKNSNREEERIKEELRQQKNIVITFKRKDIGSKIMLIYIDIYGNEFKEVLSSK